MVPGLPCWGREGMSRVLGTVAGTQVVPTMLHSHRPHVLALLPRAPQTCLLTGADIRKLSLRVAGLPTGSHSKPQASRGFSFRSHNRNTKPSNHVLLRSLIRGKAPASEHKK